MKDEFLTQFPESTREWDEVKNVDTPTEFFDRMGHMRSKFGTALFAPSKEAGAEDVQKFLDKAIELSDKRLMPTIDLEDETQRDTLYNTLGRPADAKGYDFEDIEGANHSDDRKALLSEIAFKAGLSKAQLRSIDSELRQNDITAMSEAKTAQATALKELKTEWGTATEDRIHLATKAAETFFPSLKGVSLGAADLKSFHAIAKQLGGNGSREFNEQGSHQQAGMTKDEAQTQIDEIRGNSKHPYFDPSHRGHKAAKQKMRSLYQTKHGISPDGTEGIGVTTPSSAVGSV